MCRDAVGSNEHRQDVDTEIVRGRGFRRVDLEAVDEQLAVEHVSAGADETGSALVRGSALWLDGLAETQRAPASVHGHDAAAVIRCCGRLGECECRADPGRDVRVDERRVVDSAQRVRLDDEDSLRRESLEELELPVQDLRRAGAMNLARRVEREPAVVGLHVDRTLDV